MSTMKREKILMNVAEKVGPLVSLILSEMIQMSVRSSFIRQDDTQRILFDIKHDTLRKKFRLKSTTYWFYIQQLIDEGIVYKHNLKLEGKLNYKIFIEFDFAKLNSYVQEEESDPLVDEEYEDYPSKDKKLS